MRSIVSIKVVDYENGLSPFAKCILVWLSLLFFPAIARCQAEIIGSWKVIKTLILVTGDREGKEALYKKCVGSVVNISKHSIKFKSADACILDDIDSFSIKSDQKLNRRQMHERFDFDRAEISNIFPGADENAGFEILTTDYVEEGMAYDPMAIFVIDKKKIAIYAEPVLIILMKQK